MHFALRNNHKIFKWPVFYLIYHLKVFKISPAKPHDDKYNCMPIFY